MSFTAPPPFFFVWFGAKENQREGVCMCVSIRLQLNLWPLCANTQDRSHGNFHVLLLLMLHV